MLVLTKCANTVAFSSPLFRKEREKEQKEWSSQAQESNWGNSHGYKYKSAAAAVKGKIFRSYRQGRSASAASIVVVLVDRSRKWDFLFAESAAAIKHTQHNTTFSFSSGSHLLLSLTFSHFQWLIERKTSTRFVGGVWCLDAATADAATADVQSVVLHWCFDAANYCTALVETG